MNKYYLINDRKYMEEKIKTKLNIKYQNNLFNKINSSRTIGDYTEIYIREIFNSDNVCIGAKALEDMVINNMYFDIKSSRFDKNGNYNLISPFVLLKNIDKCIFYIFTQYIILDVNNLKQVEIKNVIMRHFTELDFNALSFTSAIGRGQLQYSHKKILKIVNNSLLDIQKIVINKGIEANKNVIGLRNRDIKIYTEMYKTLISL